MEVLAQYHLFNDRLPKETGIYAIANISNGKLYIGSASSVHKRPSKSGFRTRFVDHRKLLRKKKHHAKKLNNAFWAEGVNQEDFVVWILEYCPPEKCIEREQWYFDTYKPWYNSLPVAGSPLGHIKSEEAIELNSKSQSISTTLYYKPTDEYIEMEGIMRYTKNVNKDLRPGPLYCVKGGILYQHRGFYLTKEYAYNKDKWLEDHPVPSSDTPGVMWSRLWRKWVVRPRYNNKVYNLGAYDCEAEAIAALKEFRNLHPVEIREVPKSKYKGVSWNSTQSKWKAQPYQNGKQYFLGYFDDEKDAISACKEFQAGNKDLLPKMARRDYNFPFRLYDQAKGWVEGESLKLFAETRKLDPAYLNYVVEGKRYSIDGIYESDVYYQSKEKWNLDHPVPQSPDPNITWDRIGEYWKVRIYIHKGKNISLGNFTNHEDAIAAINTYESENKNVQISRKNKNVRDYIGIDPSGKLYAFTKAKKFCGDNPEYGLRSQSISNCARGISEHHKGWKFYYAEDYYASLAS